MRRLLKLFVVFIFVSCPVTTQGNEVHPIEQTIESGNLAKAEELIESVPQNTSWLGQLAAAQVKQGDLETAKTTLRRIEDSNELRRASQTVAAATNSTSASGAQGGATGADFDSLINLITTTVEPDSWDDVGGPGTIVEFPGGVDVNASGILNKRKPKKTRKALDFVRRQADPKKTSAEKRQPAISFGAEDGLAAAIGT